MLTVSNGEGCGIVLPGTGIMPNNMLGEDDLVPGDWLGWTPDTRLSSMMAPAAVTWPGGRRAMLGSGGSNRIRTALAQVMLGLVDADLPLDAAIEAPRVHVEQGKERPQIDAELSGLSEGHREALLNAYQTQIEKFAADLAARNLTLDPDRTYRVATIEFIANEILDEVIGPGEIVAEHGHLREMSISYVRSSGVV